jgi:Zn-dependent peptidase ImmA (M78 family)
MLKEIINLANKVYLNLSGRDKILKQKWLTAYEKAKTLTGFDISIRFINLGYFREIANYYLWRININNAYPNSRKIDDDIKLGVMLHEYGHYFINTYFFGHKEMLEFHKAHRSLEFFLNHEVDELLADKFIELVLNFKKVKRRKEIFKKYEKHFAED